MTAAPQAEPFALAEATGAGLFQARVRSGGHDLLMNEPVDVGGLDTGPNPFGLLRVAQRCPVHLLLESGADTPISLAP